MEGVWEMRGGGSERKDEKREGEKSREDIKECKQGTGENWEE